MGDFVNIRTTVEISITGKPGRRRLNVYLRQADADRLRRLNRRKGRDGRCVLARGRYDFDLTRLDQDQAKYFFSSDRWQELIFITQWGLYDLPYGKVVRLDGTNRIVLPEGFMDNRLDGLLGKRSIWAVWEGADRSILRLISEKKRSQANDRLQRHLTPFAS